ncbi:hypothetical protein KJ359_000818 [Pestalotiopsis sp. 9143b]|nr:hypothetical protein KJ359_000818 [Pestalotiopsis sp. 9143b]
MSHNCGSFNARREKATEGWENGRGNGKITQAFQRAQKLQIREGQVSFLKSSDAFSRLDYDCLIASGNLPARATCHPVVVLRYRPNATHAVVTTISAYSSGDFNNNRAPWKQHCHRSKEPNEFRAFVGSERPNQKRAHLALQGGKMMPKPKVSWVHVRTAFVVPITTLGWYNKSGTTLHLTEGSLEDLRNHMMILNGPDTLGSCLEDRRLQYSLAGGAITMACPLRQTTQSKVGGVAVTPAQQIPRRAPTQPRIATIIPAQQKVVAKPQPGLHAGNAWSKPLIWLTRAQRLPTSSQHDWRTTPVLA